ncbi:MAG: hypothetical protein AB1407_07655 [Spirochaetota bacterium]
MNQRLDRFLKRSMPWSFLPLALSIALGSCATAGGFLPSPYSLAQGYLSSQGTAPKADSLLLGQKTGTPDLFAPLVELPKPSTYMYEIAFEPDPWTGKEGNARKAISGEPDNNLADKTLDEGPGIDPKAFSLAQGEKYSGAPEKAREIAARRFSQAYPRLDALDRAELLRLAGPASSIDDFSENPPKAKQLSLLVGFSIGYGSKRDFSIAFAAALFAMDPRSSRGAENLASAILGFGDVQSDLQALQECREDAKTLYALAVGLSLDSAAQSPGTSPRPAYTPASLSPLLNLGNLLLDHGPWEEAREIFLAARSLSRRSWEAALGLAGSYFAQGNKAKADSILRDPLLDRPALYAAAAKSEESLERTEKAAGIPLESPDQTYEESLATLQAEPILTAAEFIASLDQEERTKLRLFVENLPVKGSFIAPPITMVAQYSTLKAISQPMGIGALMDFSEALGRYSIRTSASMAKEQIAMAERMGMKIDLGVDLDDVAAHPEKYQDYNPDVRVSGQENVHTFASDLEKDAKRAEAELATGKTETTLKMAAKVDPAFEILRINPADYADPFNILIQRHNFAVFTRKTNAYQGYLFSANKRAHFAVEDIIKRAAWKLGELEKAMDDELEAFDLKKQAAEKSGQNTNTAEWKLKEHGIHKKYFTEMNSVAEVAWNQATSVASVNYLRKIKPQAEAYYYDVLRHLALISDPEVRSRKEQAFKASIDQAVHWGLCTVLTAFGSLRYSDEWDCDCDIKALTAQREEERKALEHEENQRIERSMAAKKRFESGEIPDSSPLFKKLDAYGTDLDIPFIPFLSGRISCAKTVVRLDFKLPLAGSPSFSGGWAESAFTGATTYSGGVSVSLSADTRLGQASAALSTKLSIDVDGRGVVSDYSVTGGAKVGLSGKAGELSVGGEATVGADGSVVSDFSASAQTSLKTAFGDGTVGFEASTQRGSSVTAKLEQSLAPMQELLDKGSEAYFDEAGDRDAAEHSPTKDLLKKELWSGSYAF